MANKRLLAIVTVLILVGSSGTAQQEVSTSELLELEKLIDSGDWRGLYSYLENNPQLTAGTSPLALELRSFSDDAKNGRLDSFDVVSNDQVSRNQSSLLDSDATIY